MKPPKNDRLKRADVTEVERFRKQVDAIRNETAALPKETAPERQTRIARLLGDYGAFCGYYFPHYCKVPSAPFHLDAAHLVRTRPEGLFVFEMFRAAAKSTHFTIFLPLWLKALGDMKFMVLIGVNNKAAVRLLSDVQAELEGNARYIADFGEQTVLGSWEAGDFQSSDGTYFVALGRGQRPRGLRKGPNRPDYIVADDIDDDELVRNDTRTTDVMNWIQEAVIPTMDGARRRFVASGNRIHQKSLIARLAENPRFLHTKVNALDASGRPTWPAKYTEKYFADVRLNIGSIAFEKEYMNNPVEAGRVFKSDWLQWKPLPPLREYQQIVGYFDPSFTPTGDFKAIKVWGTWKAPDGVIEFHLIAAFVRRCEMAEALRWMYDFDERTKAAKPVSWHIENQFLNGFFLDAFTEEDKRRRYTFNIRRDTRKKDDKAARIERLTALYERRVVWYNDAERNSPDMREALSQLLGFERGGSMNDDSPDADEGAIWILNQPSVRSGFSIQIGKRELKIF